MKWFKHFTNASSNNKLTKVRMRYGAEGYAIYWYCLELIAGDLGESKDINFDLNHDAEVIGFNLKIDQLRVEEIMKYMISIGLFAEMNGVISCIKLAKYLDIKTTSNESIKKIINAVKTDSGDRSGYLYLMLASFDGYPKEVKIGRSTNPWARLPEIHRSREKEGFSVTLLATFKTDDCIFLEKALHDSFKHINIKNEWFQYVDHIKSLAESINKEEFSSNDDLLRSHYVANSSATTSGLDEIRLDKNKPLNPIDTNVSIARNEDHIPDAPHREVISLYAKHLPMGIQPKSWDGARAAALKIRWREKKERQDLSWWNRFFGYIAKSDFLTGRVTPKNGKPFEIDLPWILKKENFDKIIDGKYDNR